MKKVAVVSVLALSFQLITMVSFAGPIILSGAGGAVVLFAELFGSDSPKKESALPKKGLTEFAALNNNASFSSLLKQTAGGSLNTLDILK